MLLVKLCKIRMYHSHIQFIFLLLRDGTIALCYVTFFSGPFHRERRRYLRVALNELYQLLSDSPGLLGPKVMLVWCMCVTDFMTGAVGSDGAHRPYSGQG